MATIDDVYALLQTTNTKIDAMQQDVNDLGVASASNQYHIESVSAMLATISPIYAYGVKLYVDKTIGNDNNSGAFESPFATIGKARSVAVAGRHDVIIVLQAATPYDELVVLDKDGLILLGTGGNCTLDPGAAAADHTVKITAPNCAVLGFGSVVGRNGHNAVRATNADYIVLQRSLCKTDGTADIDAVVVDECLVPVLGPELSASHCDGHGLVVTSVTKACHWARIRGVTAHQCGGDGLHLAGNVDRALVDDCYLHDNAGYGAYVGGSRNVIRANNHIQGNTLGQAYDATGNNFIDDGGLALSVITGIADLGVDVMTTFRPVIMEKGEEKTIIYQMTEDGVSVDCSGYTFKIAVKEKVSDAAYKIGPISGVLSADAYGRMSLVTFTVPMNTTKAMTPFGGVYSAAMYDGSGNKVPLTQAGGVQFTLKEDVLDVP